MVLMGSKAIVTTGGAVAQDLAESKGYEPSILSTLSV